MRDFASLAVGYEYEHVAAMMQSSIKSGFKTRGTELTPTPLAPLTQSAKPQKFKTPKCKKPKVQKRG